MSGRNPRSGERMRLRWPQRKLKLGWNITGAGQSARQAAALQLDLIADLFVGLIIVHTPVDTGNLKSNTDWRRLRQLARRIFNNTEYAIDVEFGTPPHTIRPKNKKALAFNLVIEGGQVKRIVVKSVQHPGTPPQPFFRTGITAAKAQTKRLLR